MKKIIRFGAFIREITIRQQQVSYNELTPKVEKNEEGKEMPHHASRLQVRSIDVYRILKPYINTRLKEQIKAVVPLAVYLVLFQIIILRQGVTDSWQITGGMISVIIGLMFFMEGLKVGLMPFGESIGTTLPAKLKLHWVMLIAFILGIGVTYAEPAIGALKAAGAIVDVNQALIYMNY